MHRRHILCALVVPALLIFSSPACLAASTDIQMLPPQDFSNNICDSGSSGILQWDGLTAGTPIRCIPNFTGDSSGNVGIGVAPSASTKLSVNGPIKPGTVSLGSACSTEGSFAYDLSIHNMVFCNQSGVWTRMGGRPNSYIRVDFMQWRRNLRERQYRFYQ
jgi:hypothetical protein